MANNRLTPSKFVGDSAGVLNVIRNNASAAYQDQVPVAESTTESIRAVGTAILNYMPHRLEFWNALIGRIGVTIIKNRLWSNPFSPFYRGTLEAGETIQEIYMGLCKAHDYDPSGAEITFSQRERANVYSMFHTLNFKKFYKTTYSPQDLDRAFVSVNALVDFLMALIQQMYNSMNYDMYLIIQYMFGRLMLDGYIPMVTIEDYTAADNANAIVQKIKEVSLDFRILSGDYTVSGVENFADVYDQFLLGTNSFQANIDVNSLATAFNLPYREFLGQQIAIGNFSPQNQARLDELLENDPNYVKFSGDDLAKLSSVGAVLCSRYFPMIYTKFLGMGAPFNNGESLYTNQWLHNWQVISASPFECVCGFTTQSSGVTSVTVSGAAEVSKGTQSTYTANVVTTGFTGKGVTWSIAAQSGDLNANTRISDTGVLTVSGAETVQTIIVTATSNFDPEKSGTLNVTVSGN